MPLGARARCGESRDGTPLEDALSDQQSSDAIADEDDEDEDFLQGRPMGLPEAKLEMGLGKQCHWTNC